MDVRPVGDAVGLTEAFEECIAQWNTGDQFAGKRVAHLLCGRTVGIGEHRFLKADLFRALGRYLGRAGCQRRLRGIPVIARIA